MGAFGPQTPLAKLKIEMKRFVTIILLLLCVANVWATEDGWCAKALERTVIDYGVSELPSLTTPHTLQTRPLTFWNNRTTQVGFGLVGAGLVLTSVDQQTRTLRTDYLPTFRYKYDDYLQFAPVVAMVAMKACGLESRSSWGRMVASGGISTGLMLSTVYVVKYGLGRLRPDGSTYNSFPSGHTAMAFTSATLLHKEYGHLSPWVSIAGYTAATVTGISRALNNRHWLSDIVVGAGVGILSTELGYLLTDKLLGNWGVVRPVEEWEPVRTGRRPSYVGVGVAHNALVYDSDRYERATPSGVGFSLEGAWFLNSHLGVGGAFKVGRYANLVERELIAGGSVREPRALNNMSLTAGLFYSHPLWGNERLLLGAKALVGVGRNHRLENEIVDSSGATVAIVEFENGEHLTATAGVSLRWIVADNLGVRAYADYNYIRTDWRVTPTASASVPASVPALGSASGVATHHASYLRPLTFGVAVDAMLW